ncbi:MAG: hypothetical protein M1431_05235 [Candidatus Thermoplasmatota archaeon]|nr:hypothetical protein [Candidatus Thermoplasmatota archaeon]
MAENLLGRIFPKGWQRHFWGKFMGFGLLFIGAGFYVAWSIVYNTWTDVGLTSFVIPMVIFGVLELALVQAKIRQEDTTTQ